MSGTALGIGIWRRAMSAPLIINVTGQASGTDGTLTFAAIGNLAVKATGDVTIDSTTTAADGDFRLHTVVFNCTEAGTGGLVIANGRSKIVALGNHGGAANPTTQFYNGAVLTMPKITMTLNDLGDQVEKIQQTVALVGVANILGNKALPAKLVYADMRGNNHQWGSTAPMPTGLLYWIVNSTAMNWTGTVIGQPNIALPKPVMTQLQLFNFRTSTMSLTDLVAFLTAMFYNTQQLPNVVLVRNQLAANVTDIAAATASATVGNTPEHAKWLIAEMKKPVGDGGRGVGTSFTLNSTAI